MYLWQFGTCNSGPLWHGRVHAKQRFQRSLVALTRCVSIYYNNKLVNQFRIRCHGGNADLHVSSCHVFQHLTLTSFWSTSLIIIIGNRMCQEAITYKIARFFFLRRHVKKKLLCKYMLSNLTNYFSPILLVQIQIYIAVEISNFKIVKKNIFYFWEFHFNIIFVYTYLFINKIGGIWNL